MRNRLGLLADIRDDQAPAWREPVAHRIDELSQHGWIVKHVDELPTKDQIERAWRQGASEEKIGTADLRFSEARPRVFGADAAVVRVAVECAQTDYGAADLRRPLFE